MTSNGRTDLAAAYDPFVELLRDGTFGDPGAGRWSAEMVAAHVARNNECFAAAARAVAAGEVATYDNEIAIDDAELRTYVERVGDRAALAEWVRRSADALAVLHASLDDDQRASLMHTTLRHEGQIIVDEPRALGTMIENNASFHLGMHLDQLRALTTSA